MYDKEKYIEEIQQFLRDLKEKNRLNDWELESTPSDIKLAIKLAIVEMNTMEPLTSLVYSDEYFEDDSVHILTYGVISKVLESASLEQERNRLDYQDGGGSYRVNDKFQSYSAASDKFYQKFVTQVNAIKRNQAFKEGFGGVSSPYSLGRRFRV